MAAFAAGDVGKEILALISGTEVRARVAAVNVGGSTVTLDLRRRSTEPPVERDGRLASAGQATFGFAQVDRWAVHVPGSDIAWLSRRAPVRGALRDARGGRGRF
jgi:hypothetical protein